MVEDKGPSSEKDAVAQHGHQKSQNQVSKHEKRDEIFFHVASMFIKV
jgi:hypothetical protein